MFATSSCGKVEPVSESGSAGINILDTSVNCYYTDIFSKDRKQEIIVTFWDNVSGYPIHAMPGMGGDSTTYLECYLIKSNPIVKFQCVADFDVPSGKGRVDINGAKFDISNGRLFLINTYVTPIKVTQINEQFKNAMPSESYFEYLAKNNKEVAAFIELSKEKRTSNKEVSEGIEQYDTVEAIKPIQKGKFPANYLIVKKINGIELEKPFGAQFKAAQKLNLNIILSKVTPNKKIIAKGVITFKDVDLPNIPNKDSALSERQRIIFFNVAKFIDPENIAQEYEDLKNKKKEIPNGSM